MMAFIGWFLSFLNSQFFITPPVQDKDCSGKTVIVTGANVGLGKEAARRFVDLNSAKVILACRNREKAEAAKEDIERTTGRQGVVEVWSLDLASFESVKEFGRKAQGLERVDIVIENAGISTSKFKLVEGNESTITVNVISTFLLALLMIPKMQETSRKFNVVPTLTVVSSETHFLPSFEERKTNSIFDTLSTERTARMADRYPTSKLLEVFACREIARLHPAEQLHVTLNFVNPGLCHSELVREARTPLLNLFISLLARTTEVGSRTLVHAGLQGPETHGKYLSDTLVAACAPIVDGQEGHDTQRKVWQELNDKLNEIQPGLTDVLTG